MYLSCSEFKTLLFYEGVYYEEIYKDLLYLKQYL